MSGILGYTKKFIILKKDFTNMLGFNPKGHGKIEIKGLKGSLSLSIENAEEEEYYNVLLLSKNKTYDLGKIYTEKNGKGREELTFNLSDLEGKGFSADRINGILIKRDEKILLGGYMDKEDGSIEGFIRQLETKNEPLPIVQMPIVNEVIAEETLIQDEQYKEIIIPLDLDDEVLQEDTLTEEAMVHDLFKPVEVLEEEIEAVELEQDLIEAVVEEAPEEIVFINEPEIEQIDDDEEIKAINVEPEIIEGDGYVPEFEPILDLKQDEEAIPDIPKFEESNEEVIEIRSIDYEHNRRIIQKNQTTDYVLNILRYFPYVDPFRINLDGYNWWRIDFQDEAKGFLPYFSYVVGGEQKVRARDNNIISAKEMMSMYNHYLFGLYSQSDEVKYYVYGVPGGFYTDEHPHNGATGFNTWFAGNEIPGYWLIYIDPLNGKVIYPVNPMKPME